MVSLSCLSHTVLILIIFVHQSKSTYLCAKSINLVQRVELNYNEFRIYPGENDKDGNCDWDPNKYAYMALKKNQGWKSICECVDVQDGYGLCLRVAEVDSNREEHCGVSSFSLSKGVEKSVRVNVKRRCGAGNTDGKVDVKMVYQDCNNCNGCSSSSSDSKDNGGSSGGCTSCGGGGNGRDPIIALAMENDEEVDNYSMLQSEQDKTPQNRTMFITIGASTGLFVLCMILTVFVCIRRKGGNKYQSSNTQNDEESDNEMVENVELEMMNNEMDTIEERIKEKVTAS